MGALQPSQTVGDRYQILDYLGGGESTEVYRVKDIIADRVLAIKVLREDAGREGELRLSREFYYLSRFAHAGIAAAYDYGTAGEHRPFFTMEFVDGIPINVFFPNGYTPELVPVTVQILKALDSIHAQGLIHCDIKPQHILIVSGPDGPRAKLLDFGFADKATLTEGTLPRGTLGYVAPEVFKGADVDARADLYSLGMVLYETVTGRGPANEADLRAWLRMQYYSEFAPPRQFDPNIPEQFEQVILSLIRREPERRPRSARAVVEMLVGPGEDTELVTGPRRYLMVPGFVGRDEHLAALKEKLGEAGRGQAGAVCISGERGVGKSRLLSEFKFLAQLEGATILGVEPASLGARSQSLVEALLSYLRVYCQPGLPTPDSGHALSEESKFRLFEAVTQRLRELSFSHRVGHSLVLLVDDLELFDPTSLEFLRYLVFSLSNERLLVLVAGLKEKRFLDLVAEFERRPCFLSVSLPPMETAEVRGLAASLLGDFSQLDELAGWLAQTTGGNPLFAIESVHSLIENRILSSRAGGWSLEPDALKAYRPPDTVTDAVRRRVENLTAEEMEVLQLGAAAGGPFTLEFLRAVLSFDDKVLFNVIGQLKAQGLLRSFVADGQAALILSSKILEAVVTERLPIAQRRENHRRVALALELLYPEKQDKLVFDLAHHYAQAGISDRAYAYSVRAGQRARESLLTEQALGFYETALGLSTQTAGPRERIGLIETVGELREATGRYAEAVDIYTQGMSIIVSDRELSREKQLLARFLRKLGLVHQRQGHGDEALNLLNQALLLQTEKGTSEHIQVLNDLGWSYCAQGDFDRAEGLLTQALQLAEKAHAHAISARTLYYFSVLAWSRYDFVLALQLAERSLSIYESLRDDYNTGHVAQFIATLWWRRGELGRARELYERYLSVQRRSGDVYYLLRSLQGLGVVSQEEGEWTKAREYFLEGLALAERIGDMTAAAELNSNLGMVCDELGHWSVAMSHLTRAVDLQQRAGTDVGPVWRAAVKANIAQLASKQGRQEEADRAIQEAESLAGRTNDASLRINIALVRFEMLLRAEKYGQARTLLAQTLALARHDGDWRRLAALRTRAAELRLASGDPARAADEARRALVLLNDYRSSKEYAVALRLSGLAKCQLDRPERGAQEIARSVELLREMGAKHEMALSLLASAQALTRQDRGEQTINMHMPMTFRPVSQQTLSDALANLREAQEVLKALGAQPDAQRADDLMETLTQVSATMSLKANERGEYLKVFYQLSELMSLDMDKDDFLERVLDLVIDVTKAERGLIFLVQGDRLTPVAARNVDHATMEDAESVTRSVLRRVKRRGELLFSSDALADPRFNTSNSVVLNKIRSLLCAPLLVEGRVIGTIYLDSRITAHLFLEEDNNLLMSVANLLAATIDKSVAFRRMQEEMSSLREDILVDAVTGYFLGRSRPIKEVYRIVERIAPSDCTVLLTGETGTGKGIIARLIHSRSERRGGQFVAVNCGTLPETLFESELFGHARGSFTGAVKDKEGLFETAANGTVFLDEISNTTLGVQAKLLQVLEERVIRRVGETQTRHVDVRMICATNRNLEEEVAAGRFREDLYYRMNVVTIHVPPLRERTGDIPLLARYFLRRYATQMNKSVSGFEEGVITAFSAYSWPGNVRELQNVIERAVIMTRNRRIGLDDVGGRFTQGDPIPETQSATRRRLITREAIVEALRDTDGNISRAAELLSTHRRQLQRLIRRYRIDRTQP